MSIRNINFAFRNITKNKLNSAIIVLSLSLGLSAVLIIFSWSSFEFSYDGYHQKKDRIYRVLDYQTAKGKDCMMVMLNRDFVKWVAIAFLIATPLAYFATNKWLENFTYKTTLGWWIFALAGLIVLRIALLTVSWQSWRAARRNPVEALRYE